MINKLRNSIINYSRRQKQFVLIIFDLIILEFSLILAFYLKFNFVNFQMLYDNLILFLFLPISVPFFIILGLYRAVLKHIGLITLIAAIKAISFSLLVLVLVLSFFNSSFSFQILIIYWFISVTIILGFRFYAFNFLYKIKSGINILIYGAGEAGIQLAQSIKKNKKFKLIYFIDDDVKKDGMILNSTKIVSSKKLNYLIKNKNIKIALLAIPSLSSNERKKILSKLSDFPLKVMELPSIEKIIGGQVTINDIKEVNVSDIIGRDLVKPDKHLLSKNIKDKIVLVSGAGGSIGSELCRQIIVFNPKVLIFLDNTEYNLYKIKNDLENNFLNVEKIFILASVTNNAYLKNLFNNYKIDTVYHAAAYKHVPLLEDNIYNAVLNNIVGTYNLSMICNQKNIDSFIFISTDKAVNPTNIMGATKRFCEMILQSLNHNKKHTIFSIVRFGNVLDSAGSVLPLFRKQIKQGGPITVTHREISRYFMSIPEAVQLVIQAGSMSKGGEVFILDMGSPMKIYDLAKKMIHLSGMKVKNENNESGDILIKITGLRPGEKLKEELLISNKFNNTKHPKIFHADEPFLSNSEIEIAIKEFQKCIENADNIQMKKILEKYVKEYHEKDL